jgi:glutathione S-transferase
MPIKAGSKYTVPAIHHVPTNTFIMDSVPISSFLESTYPRPPLPLSTDLGREVEADARKLLGPVVQTSIMPREIQILSPRAQEYFRRTREAALGHPLEDLLSPDKEEKMWAKVDSDLNTVGQMMQKHSSDEPFVHGKDPSLTDFFIAGALQSARVVDEGVFQRMIKHPGFHAVYTACLPWMERKD